VHRAHCARDDGRPWRLRVFKPSSRASSYEARDSLAGVAARSRSPFRNAKRALQVLQVCMLHSALFRVSFAGASRASSTLVRRYWKR
jgi:hypothetical protein